jgi:steroid 5-alpha reductase family enzyme
MVLWLSGFMVQAIADYQLSSFKKHKQPGQILQTGLWQYSRHPNYLGEIIMWWGIWLILPAWWTLISPILITYLIAFVSGVPMLEEKYKGNPAFEAYKKRTPALFPRWPK